MSFFGGESSASGGSGGNSSVGRIWGFQPGVGWILLYQLPLGQGNSGFSHQNSNWWNAGGTVTSGNGKYAAYDSIAITHIGFSAI
jgi:hypothetical protein